MGPSGQSPEMPVQAAIIGCGMMAGGYDNQAPDGSPRTHAGALVRCGARIVACVEPDAERRKAFQARWSIPHGYPGVEEMLVEHEDLEIACVATPDERHAADLDVLLTVPVKTVFCE